MNNFKLETRWHIANAFDVPPTDVIIINVSQGSINVDFVIVGFNSLIYSNYLERIDHARESLRENMKITIIDKKQMTYLLNVNDFDIRGDFTFFSEDDI